MMAIGKPRTAQEIDQGLKVKVMWTKTHWANVQKPQGLARYFMTEKITITNKTSKQMSLALSLRFVVPVAQLPPTVPLVGIPLAEDQTEAFAEVTQMEQWPPEHEGWRPPGLTLLGGPVEVEPRASRIGCVAFELTPYVVRTMGLSIQSVQLIVKNLVTNKMAVVPWAENYG